MLVARTPPPTSPVHHDLVSRDFFQGPHHQQSARPAVARRPSALRNASSDHLITPAVTRFATGQPASIPPPASAVSPGSEPLVPTASASSPDGIVRPSPVRAVSSSSSRGVGAKPTGPASSGSLALPSPGLAAGAAVATSPPVVRPSLNPLGGSNDSGGPSSSGSLLARRRSSRSTARPDNLPLLADLSLAGALPSPSLAELDDDVRPTVIGESSHAQTPASEASSPVVARAPGAGGVKQLVESEFRSTRDWVSTPFPGKPDWIDEEDELDSPVRTSTAQRDAVVGTRREDDARAP
ncbi:hypothetical protein JCM8208_001407 [Rhodotorula glutinis]